MSVTCIYTVHCDLCGAWDFESVHGASAARETAKIMGWKRQRIDGRLADVCDTCVSHPLNGADRSGRRACGQEDCRTCTGAPFMSKLREGYVLEPPPAASSTAVDQ